MSSTWQILSLVGLSAMVDCAAAAQSRSQIEFANRTPEGLVGNGHSVVKVQPGGYEFHTGGDGSGHFRLVVGGVVHELSATDARASFFPGGVVYALTVAGVNLEILHGALPEVPYLAAVRVSGAHGRVELEIDSQGAPAATPSGRALVRLDQGAGQIVLAAGAAPPTGTWAQLGQKIEAPYRGGLTLETPNPAVDRAVAFSRFLLDLGFDGRLHVCEIFRWRDVWSRDLGSGLAPGAMVSGRFSAAYTTIAYDLRRYAAAEPHGLKVTQDPSQGGTAEGTAWLARAVWREYLLTGDVSFLRDAARILRPWVETWIDRDPDESGLLIDVSEWMDHSRFFLFPDGARVLYSNVLFADLLRTFARIETALGDGPAARRYDDLRRRFVRGINDGLWNEAAGAYDNLVLWGRRDGRIASAENALAVLCGVAPADRARRALATVRELCWRPAGSVTITPLMTHVDEHNDHNGKVWPWWNAVEARARFRTGDAAGGLYLLERCAATLADEHYPGLIEELTTPEGVSEGGHAFLSAAGSYLDAIYEGLLGIEILEPGRARVRVSPNVPASWRDWRARVPLPGGELVLEQRQGHLRVRVTDPGVRIIEAPSAAVVEGATKVSLSPLVYPVLGDASASSPNPLPEPHPRTAAVFVAPSGLPAGPTDGLPATRVAAEDLLHLDPAVVGALIVPGNALPRRTADGGDVPAALARYIDHGGALVFYGATMHDRGTMGEHGGVIDWYEQRPVVRYEPIGGWRFRPAMDDQRVAHDNERGLAGGWHRFDFADTDWAEARVPAAWEIQLGYDYDGWGWYRAHFTLLASARGHVVVLDLGTVDDSDWTYVNGTPVGTTEDAHSIRHYRIRPADPAYASLVFGGDNLVSLQVLDTGGAGGMLLGAPRIGVETAEIAWTPIDPTSGEAAEHPTRLGVVSWGLGAFFNSWETARGAFGFRVDGHGVEFVGRLAGLAPLAVEVSEAFTDFAVSRPWRFEPLAYTQTRRGLLVPDHGERYPCLARLVNTATGGEILLVPASIVRTPAGREVLRVLRIGAGPRADPVRVSRRRRSGTTSTTLAVVGCNDR